MEQVKVSNVDLANIRLLVDMYNLDLEAYFEAKTNSIKANHSEWFVEELWDNLHAQRIAKR